MFNRGWKRKGWEFGHKKVRNWAIYFIIKKVRVWAKKVLDWTKKVRDWAINLSIKKSARLGKKGASLGNLFFNLTKVRDWAKKARDWIITESGVGCAIHL